MAHEIRSISQVGTSEPFELQVARGQIPGHSFVHKFGANFDIDNNSEPETVWTFGGLYPWSALSSAQILYCASTSGSDTDALEIYGLDADFNEQIETVQLDGTNPVTTTQEFLRVYRMIYRDSAQNAGVITARVVSGAGTVVADIQTGFAQTLMALFTVPAGHTAYLLCGDLSVQKNKDAQVLFFQRPFGSNFRIAHMAEVYENTYRYDFPIPIPLPEKTDLEVRVDNVETNNTRVTANFDLILVKNGGPL